MRVEFLMSELAFRRNFELKLPSSFVDVEREEMEYVDGGFNLAILRQNVLGVAAVCAAATVIVKTLIIPFSNNNVYFTALAEQIAPAVARVGVLLSGLDRKQFLFTAGAVGAVYALGTYRVFY